MEGLILGIDPGSRATGYGVVSSQGNRLTCLDFGVIRPPVRLELYKKLDFIYKALLEIISKYSLQYAAVEQVFHSVNSRTALVLGEVRGAIVLAAVHGGLNVSGYSPSEIKQAVTGYGRAEKTQVQYMVRVLLGIRSSIPSDAADALAVAICHSQRADLLLANNVKV